MNKTIIKLMSMFLLCAGTAQAQNVRCIRFIQRHRRRQSLLTVASAFWGISPMGEPLTTTSI